MEALPDNAALIDDLPHKGSEETGRWVPVSINASFGVYAWRSWHVLEPEEIAR